MDTERAQTRLYELIDNEASAIEKEELLKLLESNPELKARFELEVKVRSFVAATSAQETCPASLRARIISALDGVDHEGAAASSTASSTPHSHTQFTDPKPASRRYTLVMAASLALVILGGYSGVSFLRHQDAFGAIENQHFLDLEGVRFGDLQTVKDATQFIERSFAVSVIDSLPDMTLCGGKLVKLKEQEFAHFRFCSEANDPVSIFIGSATESNIPNLPSTIVAGKEFFRHSCHGCELLYWRQGNALIVAATSRVQMDSRPINALVRDFVDSLIPTGDIGAL